jgi:hypothetical protein
MKKLSKTIKKTKLERASKKDTTEFENFYYQIIPSAVLMKYRLAQCIQLVKSDFGVYVTLSFFIKIV